MASSKTGGSGRGLKSEEKLGSVLHVTSVFAVGFVGSRMFCLMFSLMCSPLPPLLKLVSLPCVCVCVCVCLCVRACVRDDDDDDDDDNDDDDDCVCVWVEGIRLGTKNVETPRKNSTKRV